MKTSLLVLLGANREAGRGASWPEAEPDRILHKPIFDRVGQFVFDNSGFEAKGHRVLFLAKPGMRVKSRKWSAGICFC